VSYASRLADTSKPLLLRQEERALINLILTQAKAGNPEALPHDAQVRDLLNGGMGGIRFVASTPEPLAKK
jgi:hypothetical protein